MFVDANAAINTAVRKVRRALGDDPDAPRFLETVVGKGYRFVGPIAVRPGAEPVPKASGGAAAPARASITGGRALGAVVLASLIVSSWRCSAAWGPGAGRPWSPSPVLPFENTGGDPEAEYLSDGLSESLINRLSRLPHLKVIARASVLTTGDLNDRRFDRGVAGRGAALPRRQQATDQNNTPGRRKGRASAAAAPSNPPA